MDDEELMREIVGALVDDTSKQLPLLQAALQEADSKRAAQVAHYCKGACANVGALSSAWLLQTIERKASNGDFTSCTESLAALSTELDRLRERAAEF